MPPTMFFYRTPSRKQLDSSSHANRVMDMALEDGEVRGPLAGFFPATLPVPTLEQALAPLAAGYPHLHAVTGVSVKLARKKVKKAQIKYPSLTMDECTAVVLYTIEEEPRETSLYYVMNAALRSKQRAEVRPWRDFIWLLLHALRKLPPVPALPVVFRGCTKAPSELGLELEAGFEVTWAGFSSTATTIEVMSTFVGKAGPRTLYTIALSEPVGRDVRDFSLFPTENEVLFPPNMCFEVVSHFDTGGGLIIVQCKQTETIDAILDMTPPADTPPPPPPPHRNADKVVRLWHGTTTSALPGILASKSLRPSVAGFFGPGVYLTSSRAKAIAWARFRAGTAGRLAVVPDTESYEMEWRNVDRVLRGQEKLPEGHVHTIGCTMKSYQRASPDERGARPVLVAVDVRLGKCKTFDAVLRDTDYVYVSYHCDHAPFIPALHERDASLQGAGPWCPNRYGLDSTRGSPHNPKECERPPPEFEVLVSDEMGRLTMQTGPKASGSAWFRRANGVDSWLQEGFDSQYIHEGLPSGSGALIVYPDAGGWGMEDSMGLFDSLGPVHDRFRGDEYVVRDGSRVVYVSHELV